MATDTRSGSARYYDECPWMPNDVPFYRALVPGADARVLELGCGTGRVLVPLAGSCGFIHGVELSEAMLGVCHEKMRAAGLTSARALADPGDMTDLGFDLGAPFDLVIAPYRVMQNLETDEQVAGLLRTVRTNLAPGATAVLNAFHPNRDREAMRRTWCRTEETLEWEVTKGDVRITCHDVRPRLDPEKLVLYPELTYRRYESGALVDEFTHRFAMRCWYPDQLETLITSSGFRVVERWGGYDGEPYGGGPELVIQFADPG